MAGEKTRTLLLCAEGPFALFTIPAFKVEKVTYDAMTPTAARGIVQALLWKPAVEVAVERIDVCNRIRHATIKVNGVGTKVSMPKQKHFDDPSLLVQNALDVRIQHQHTMLLDVRYVIAFRYVMTKRAGAGETPEKFEEMFERRLARGQYFRLPHFGLQQHSAECRPVRDDDVPLEHENRDLGMMPHYRCYHREHVDTVWFPACLKAGRLHVPGHGHADPEPTPEPIEDDLSARELEDLARQQRLERDELERMQARDRAELARKIAARKR